VVHAIVIVPAGKGERREERYEAVIRDLNSKVFPKEPNTLPDMMLRQTDVSTSSGRSNTTEFVVIGRYGTQADLDAHFVSEDVQAAIKAFDDEEMLTG
jgi:quinol monooxygenase YgiN